MPLRAVLVAVLFASPAIGQVEPITLDQLPAFYESRAAAGATPRKPYLIFGSAMRPGQVGIIPAGSVEGEFTPYYQSQVLQVLAESEMLVKVTAFVWRDRIYGEGANAVPLGKAPTEGDDTFVLVRGVDTSTLADDQMIGLAGAWRVAGTHQYQTAIGAKKTVFALEPVDLPDPPPARAVVKNAPAKQPARAMRLWTDVTGKYRIEAALIEVTKDTVILEKTDGSRVEVPLSRLVKNDREYAKSQVETPKRKSRSRR